MNMNQAWLNIYRNFDDDSLAALASVGLLRRAAKDVEAGKVTLTEPVGASFALFEADGQQVRIGDDGPVRARCDCPAPGICKHILAAALWLRNAPPVAEAAPAVDALAEAGALDPAAVFKLAGIVATRKAAALFGEAGPATLVAQGGVLVIELPALDLTCRYIAGAGFKGMVSEGSSASRAAVHVLALAAVWHSQGRAFAWPEGAQAAADSVDETLSDAERQFLERVLQVVMEMCRTGWSHVSDIMPAQLRAFGMSARIESFPRLAGMLRTLAGTAQLLAQRDVGSDERQAIKLAARIHALCHALPRASGDALQELRGRARRAFDGNEALELLPLGAHWWETRGGARGMTVAFWDHASGAILQTVLARRDASDTSFTAYSAWANGALWQGAGSAKSLSEGTLVLEGARLSGDNRISLTSETRGQTLQRWAATDPRWAAAGHDDWIELGTAIRRSAGLRGDTADCFLLKPASLDVPQLDEVRQVFNWAIRDRNGLPMLLRLPCDGHRVTRIGNIEAWATSGMAIKGVLVRLERERHGGILEPVSLMVEDKGLLRTIALDYVAPATSKTLSFVNRITRLLKSKDVAVPWPPGPSHLEHLDALVGIMENKAMTGRLHLVGEEKADLLAAQQYLYATGLDTVAKALALYLAEPDAAKALALIHLCHTCAELDTSFLYR